MKKSFFVTLLLALVIMVSVPIMAKSNIGIRISRPSPIVFAAPPELVVIPETNVYAVPDVEEEIFFYGGWWYRPWEGRWYRSRHYHSGWSYYRHIPSFYRNVPPGWRQNYRERNWQGHQWDHQKVSHRRVQGNWRNWEKNKHWEKQQTWGVQGLRSQPQPQHRESSQPSRPLYRKHNGNR